LEVQGIQKGAGEMINKGLFTSNTDNWGTPQEFFNKFNAMFDFQLDVAASAENAKCARFFSKEDNGLVQEWSNRNWMNPPYGREITEWVQKADEEAKKGNLTVALLPARTDTKWFNDFCKHWHYIFIRGRLKFGGGGSAPFPSVVVFFGIER
jgi:phage N-6-adenine-methyltransferase